jgi:NitT/TauT family transport system substrate-binding protein
MLRKISRLAAAFIGVVSAALLSLPASAQAPAPFQGEGGKVRIVQFPTGNIYPFWAIQKLGLDKKYGFELEIIPVQPGGAVATAFRSGATDGGSLNWLEIARMRTAGDKVVGVTPFLQNPNVFVAAKDSGIKGLSDFKGKNVGTYFRFSPEWLLFVAVAKSKAKYDPRTDSTMHEAGPGLLRGLLDQKQLQASFIFYNLAFPMVSSGDYQIVFASRDLLPEVGLPKDLMLSTTSFREEYIKSNPKNVRAYVLAYQDAVRYLAKNDDIWVELLARQDIRDPKVIALMRDWSRTVTLERFSPTVNEDTQKLFDVVYSVGGKEAMGIEKLPSGMFDTSFSK